MMEKDIKIEHCFSKDGCMSFGLDLNWEFFTTSRWKERWLQITIGLILINLIITLDWGEADD